MSQQPIKDVVGLHHSFNTKVFSHVSCSHHFRGSILDHTISQRLRNGTRVDGPFADPSRRQALAQRHGSELTAALYRSHDRFGLSKITRISLEENSRSHDVASTPRQSGRAHGVQFHPLGEPQLLYPPKLKATSSRIVIQSEHSNRSISTVFPYY